VFGRQLLVDRVKAGWPPAQVADQLGISRTTVDNWVGRFDAEGPAGLVDRSSRPHTSPNQVSPAAEAKVLRLRERRQAGPVVLAAELGMNPSTVGRVLARNQVPRLADLDPVTGRQIRASKATGARYEHPRAGDMVHVDVKKLGRIPPGGGWRAHGRSEAVRGRGLGYDYVHSAVDDHTRLAYSEVLPDEKDTTSAGFLHRAVLWFRGHGITIRRLLTDNAWVYRKGGDWTAVCTAWQLKRRFIKPGCPWTNGKAERFNRTLQREWAYRRPWTSNHARTRALATFLRRYNTVRGHSALGGQPPISRLTA
jgi:transposase InsO family protein